MAWRTSPDIEGEIGQHTAAAPLGRRQGVPRSCGKPATPPDGGAAANLNTSRISAVEARLRHRQGHRWRSGRRRGAGGQRRRGSGAGSGGCASCRGRWRPGSSGRRQRRVGDRRACSPGRRPGARRGDRRRARDGRRLGDRRRSGDRRRLGDGRRLRRRAGDGRRLRDGGRRCGARGAAADVARPATHVEGEIHRESAIQPHAGRDAAKQVAPVIRHPIGERSLWWCGWSKDRSRCRCSSGCRSSGDRRRTGPGDRHLSN